MLTQQFPLGLKRSSLIPWRKRVRANKQSPLARCIEEPSSTSDSKAVATKKHKSMWGEKGVVTTSEKYTIAHSNHVGIHFIALKWADLKGSKKSDQKSKEIDLRDTDSEDYTYRGNEERRRRG